MKNTVPTSSGPGKSSTIQTRWCGCWHIATALTGIRSLPTFRADPEWIALRAKYEVPINIEAFMMSASDYSALK